jgi:hypothetical protein
MKIRFHRHAIPAFPAVPAFLVAVCLLALETPAQPDPIEGANAPCDPGPIMIGGVPDTVPSVPDEAGFVSIFNGQNLQGWWESCQSPHSNPDPVNGGIWLVDPVEQAIYSEQNANGAGSLLMTNKLYMHYELIFDYWSDFGNDGGVFNRTTANGTSFQTTLDYLPGSRMGGTYFENNYANVFRRGVPYLFGNSPAIIHTFSEWTAITAARDPESYGCPSTGCTNAHWTAVWDTGGWNQIRVRFYGTGASADNKVHMEAYTRKLGTVPWVPLYVDSIQYETPPGYIGFQIHSGADRWFGPRGIWYRNIKIRPLTEFGDTIPVVSIMRPRENGRRHGLRYMSGALVGEFDTEHQLVVSDAKGRVLERFSGGAGLVSYPLAERTTGPILLEVRTPQGKSRHRVIVP